MGLRGKSPSLELEVKVLNINRGRNVKIERRCRTLEGYNAFVMKAREYEKESGDKAEAVKKAVVYCKRNAILKEFFEEHGSEVLSMLMTEWNWDDALAVRYEEGLEEGWQEGREEIARNALVEGASIEFVQKITGLDIETLENLKSAQNEPVAP